MNTRHLPGVGHLLTLVLVCLLSVACRQAAPATPASRAPASSPRNNLLRNPDFQAGTTMWEPAPAAGAAPGSASLALALDPAGFVSVAVGAPGAPRRAAWSQTVPVQPEAAYYVAYRVQTEGLAGCAGLTLGFHDAAGRLLEEMAILPVSGDTDWATYAWRCRAPAGAAQAVVSLGVDGATAGRVAFDDLCFAPDDAPLTRALIVDWREESGQLAIPAQPGAAHAAELAATLAYAQAEGSACFARGAATWAGDPLEPGSAGRLLAQLSETPRRLGTQGGDTLGFTLLAGRSDDGCLAQIIIADTGSRSEGYRLGLAGFPTGFHYTVTEIAGGAPPLVVRQGEGDAPDGLLMAAWRSPAVHLIRISWP